MTEEVKVLTRDPCLANGISPDGRQWRVLLWEDTALYEITQVREDDFGREVPDRRAYLPASLAAHFTSHMRAEAQLKRYLLNRWEESDAARAKSDKRNGKKDAA